MRLSLAIPGDSTAATNGARRLRNAPLDPSGGRARSKEMEENKEKQIRIFKTEPSSKSDSLVFPVDDKVRHRQQRRRLGPPLIELRLGLGDEVVGDLAGPTGEEKECWLER